MHKKVIIIGAGGHGRAIADIVKLSGDEVAGFLDDKPPAELPGVNVIDTAANAGKYIGGHEFIVAVGGNKRRKEIMSSLECTCIWYTAVHPSAVIASDVTIGKGSAVMANAVVNCGSRLGVGVIINTAATVDHDCIIEDYVHISPGAHVAGTVTIGSGTWLGIGAIISNNICVCEDVVVGAGAVVVKDITRPGTYVGVPAKATKQATMGDLR